VLNKLFTQVGRYPNGVLLTCLALAVGIGVLDADFIVGVIVIVLFGLAFLAEVRFHPATLALRDEPRAFDLTNNVVLLLTVGGCVFTAVGMLVGYLADLVRGDGDRMTGAVLGTFVVGLTALAWFEVLRPARVRLRPDGIEDVQAFSAMFVPWEAFAGVDHPAVALGRDQVLLTCSDQGLIRKRGRRAYGPLLQVSGNDPVFLSRVIDEYAHRPELRPAIGTAAERDRLVTSWTGSPYVP
jgi:hypothetical protein